MSRNKPIQFDNYPLKLSAGQIVNIPKTANLVRFERATGAFSIALDSQSFFPWKTGQTIRVSQENPIEEILVRNDESSTIEVEIYFGLGAIFIDDETFSIDVTTNVPGITAPNELVHVNTDNADDLATAASPHKVIDPATQENQTILPAKTARDHVLIHNIGSEDVVIQNIDENNPVTNNGWGTNKYAGVLLKPDEIHSIVTRTRLRASVLQTTSAARVTVTELNHSV